MGSRGAGLVLVAAVLGTPYTARAQELELLPKHRVVYEDLTAFRYNPWGLVTRASITYRYRLWDDPGPLFRDGRIALGLNLDATPAVIHIGPTLEVRPLTVLLLSAGFRGQFWMGSFGYLQSFDTPYNVDFSDSALDIGEDAGENYSTTGTQIALRVQLLGKVGPIVIRNDAKFYRDVLNLKDSDTVFYSIVTDHLLARKGWSYENDTDVLYLSDGPWVLGIRTTVTNMVGGYPDSAYQPGEPTDNLNGPTVRTGPLFAWRFGKGDDTDRFNNPTLLVILNWWVKHRWRTGQDVTRALPYIVVGFKFDGELWRR